MLEVNKWKITQNILVVLQEYSMKHTSADTRKTFWKTRQSWLKFTTGQPSNCIKKIRIDFSLRDAWMVKPWAIYKSRNGESENRMRGIRVGMRGIRVRIWGIRVGMQRIRVILCENLRVYCFGQNLGVRGEHFTIQLLWAAARLLVTRFLPFLHSGWVLLQGNEDVGPVQDLIFLYLCLMWIRKIRTEEEFKIPLCSPSGGNLLFRQSHI